MNPWLFALSRSVSLRFSSRHFDQPRNKRPRQQSQNRHPTPAAPQQPEESRSGRRPRACSSGSHSSPCSYGSGATPPALPANISTAFQNVPVAFSNTAPALAMATPAAAAHRHGQVLSWQHRQNQADVSGLFLGLGRAASPASDCRKLCVRSGRN